MFSDAFVFNDVRLEFIVESLVFFDLTFDFYGLNFFIDV